jgi:hypothetical protein
MATENLQLSTNVDKLFDTFPNKPCYGLNCPNFGTHILLIKLVNRIGFFCDKCKNDLESSSLIKHDFSSHQEIKFK